MAITPENLRFILGLKVKSLRQRLGEPLVTVAARVGVSVSYLSEIENGRKYPKPEVLIRLAEGLRVSYDELISPRLGGELDALEPLFNSDFFQEFPFELFGLDMTQVLGLVSDDPVKAAAFVQTFLEIARSYDMQVEHFLFAALRSYQRLHSNHFPELEERAADYRRERGWTDRSPGSGVLRDILEDEHGYQVDEETLAEKPELGGLRSVYLPGDPPRLLVNPSLAEAQRAFVYGREVGFVELGLAERPATSSWVRVDSFDQILNNFKASYFAGALLIGEDELAARMEAFFSRSRWDADGYREILEGFGTTPETFAYRLTQVLPGRMGIQALYFMRFHNPVGTERYQLNKVLNMSGIPVPRGVGFREHYCRRWVTVRILQEMARKDASAQGEGWHGELEVWGERAHFFHEDAEFFVISSARPLALKEGVNSCITVGLLMDEGFRERVRFWDDPRVARWDVGLTCERCPLDEEECGLRVAPPSIRQE